MIPAIRSRCLSVRVPAPSHEDVVSVLSMVAKKEGLNLPTELASRISEKSNRNLRRAILMLQSCKVRFHYGNLLRTITVGESDTSK